MLPHIEPSRLNFQQEKIAAHSEVQEESAIAPRIAVVTPSLKAVSRFLESCSGLFRRLRPSRFPLSGHSPPVARHPGEKKENDGKQEDHRPGGDHPKPLLRLGLLRKRLLPGNGEVDEADHHGHAHPANAMFRLEDFELVQSELLPLTI